MTSTLECHTYTHARRHPLVIGRIGGFVLPTPLTPAQAVVLLTTSAGMIGTRAVWARFPGAMDLLVAMAVPLLLTWSVRHARVEGRSPARFAAGLACYLLRPPCGRSTGLSTAACWAAVLRRRTRGR